MSGEKMKTQLHIVIGRELAAEIDRISRQQTVPASRGAAVRYLIARGLEAVRREADA